MATYQLTSWRASWHPATKNHPAYAHVTIRGDAHHLLQKVHGWEAFNIPLEPHHKNDKKTIKELVQRAMQLSQNKWHGHITV